MRRPWLSQHSPAVRWESSEILQWSESCFQNCLSNVPEPPACPSSLQVNSTLMESPEPLEKHIIPSDYVAFQDVFSKQAATKLPPHWPWDCAIDLLPGATLPKGRVYPLSIPERKAMEDYIKEALQQRFIRPSTSPAASSFFVGKKDGGLRPCIDYRTLNAQTVKLPCPLPLVPAALEELRGARIFSKLDLRSAYNLVRIREGDEWKTFITPSGHYEYRVMPYGLSNSPSVFQGFMNEVFREFLHQFVIVYIDDILIYSRNLAEHRHHVTQVLEQLRKHHLYLKLQKCEFHRPTVQFLGYILSADGIQIDQGKVQAIHDWPQPQPVKELQRFLRFANFYRRFIQNFSLLSAPLTSMLRQKPKSLSWNPEARAAFKKLQEAFCTAPILTHPDPQLPFVVEVDASTTGVGAVLSQHHREPPRLHPCAFFSKKLSPAERNYDIRNRELLAIKQALEEWRHWLEGAQHPFSMITDHKNLEYLRSANRLNPRQACWVLFFTRFQFTITYRPGDKNVKADSLSRIHTPEEPPTPEPILPPAVIVSPIQWALEEQIRVATLSEPAPPGGPKGNTYVPTTLRSTLLGSLHASPGSGHPGSQRTLSLLQARYWWPRMARDVCQYVRGCSVLYHLQVSPSPTRRKTGHLTNSPSSVVPRRSRFLSPISPTPRVSPASSSQWIGSLRFFNSPQRPPHSPGNHRSTVSPCIPQLWHPRRYRLRSWATIHLSCMESLPEAPRYLSKPVLQISPPRPTARLGGRYRKLGGISGPTAMTTSTAGTASSRGPSMHKILSSKPPPASPPSSAYSATNPLCFPWMEEPSDVPAVDHWFRVSERVWDSAHIHLQQAVRRHKSSGLTPPSITQEIKSGSRPGICVSACPAVS